MNSPKTKEVADRWSDFTTQKTQLPELYIDKNDILSSIMTKVVRFPLVHSASYDCAYEGKRSGKDTLFITCRVHRLNILSFGLFYLITYYYLNKQLRETDDMGLFDSIKLNLTSSGFLEMDTHFKTESDVLDLIETKTCFDYELEHLDDLQHAKKVLDAKRKEFLDEKNNILDLNTLEEIKNGKLSQRYRDLDDICIKLAETSEQDLSSIKCTQDKIILVFNEMDDDKSTFTIEHEDGISGVKTDLVKLGTEMPELREKLRPLLTSLDSSCKKGFL